MNDSTPVMSPNEQLANLVLMVLTDSHSGACHRAILKTAAATNSTFDAALAILIEEVISQHFEIRRRCEAVTQN